MASKKQISVLINSCDSYSNIWISFFSIFWKYWPDCSYPIYLGTGKRPYVDHRIQMVYSGDDRVWASHTRNIINQIPTDYILMLLEDFFFYKPVDSSRVSECFYFLINQSGGYLRLKPFPKPDKKIICFPDIGEILPGAPYRTALQAAIWRKDVFLSLLKDGESAWDMECYGSRRSDRYLTGFYSTWKPVLNYEAGVTMGKWLPWAVEQCHQEGIPIDTASRTILSPQEYKRWKLRIWRTKIIDSIPWRTRRPIGNFLRRLKILPPRVGEDELSR